MNGFSRRAGATGWRRAALAIALLLAAAFAAAPAGAAEPQGVARASVGTPVAAAQLLMKQKKYRQAAARLRQAEAVHGKTAYETYVVEETRAALALDTGDDKAAETALDAVLATGILPPAEARKRLATLTEIASRAKDYKAVLAYARRYEEAGGSDREPPLLSGEAAYQTGDFAAASRILRGVVATDAKAGRPTPEDTLLLLAGSAYRSRDTAGYVDALTLLVAAYPKKSYWSDVLAAVPHLPGFADRLTLDLDRLRIATGVMEQPADYMAAAELALQEGLPGEAERMLAEGAAGGVFGQGPAAERATRLAAMARREAQQDLAALPGQAREATADPRGETWARLGERYAGQGSFAEAAAALRKALQLGGLTHPGETRLHLAIALLRAGRKGEAADAFRAVQGAGTAVLARLWLIAGGV